MLFLFHILTKQLVSVNRFFRIWNFAQQGFWRKYGVYFNSTTVTPVSPSP